MPAFAYTPRDPAASVLYAVVREHIEYLAGGFARFRCDACRTERLVAFSCKGRGFCPSCGGRRMAERAAHLVDHVLSDVPVRQWVLTLPHRLRYLLAWRHDLCRAVARLLHRAVERHLCNVASQHGVRDGRGGSVAVIQRFGGSLNLNVHVHALVLDGVFTRRAGGQVRFHPAPVPSEADNGGSLGQPRARGATAAPSPWRRGRGCGRCVRGGRAALGGGGRRPPWRG